MPDTLPLAQGSELSAAAFQAFVTAGLAILALVLYRRLPERWFAWWAAAWSLYVLRLGAIIAFLATGKLTWLFWHQVATGWVALGILWAALVFQRQARWRWWYAALPLCTTAWAWVAVNGLDRFILVAIPMVALISGATLWTGWVFWRHAAQTRSPGARFVAVAFLLWGLHHLDYPFLRARGAWSPWGYYLDIVFELAVGIGFGLMVLSELASRLAARTRDLGELSTMMVRQHEAERLRLSRELHDETAQTLSAVKLEVGVLREGADQAGKVRLDRVLELVDAGIRGIRRVTNDLRPALLDDLGLAAAIRSLAEDVRARGRLEVDVSLPPELPRLPPETELALFRAAQEALANVIRHAGASRVELGIREDGDALRLTVRDNGRGLAPSGPVAHPHLGLAGMRERMLALGGSATLTPGREGGAVLTVEVPIPPS
jgi:signal transduction histidine kinase